MNCVIMLNTLSTRAWPLQRRGRGRVPSGGVERMNRFEAILVAFEPATGVRPFYMGKPSEPTTA